MKQSVEETKEQARGVADTYFDFLNKTISSFSFRVKTVRRKTKKLRPEKRRRYPVVHTAIEPS